MEGHCQPKSDKTINWLNMPAQVFRHTEEDNPNMCRWLKVIPHNAPRPESNLLSVSEIHPLYLDFLNRIHKAGVEKREPLSLGDFADWWMSLSEIGRERYLHEFSKPHVAGEGKAGELVARHLDKRKRG